MLIKINSVIKLIRIKIYDLVEYNPNKNYVYIKEKRIDLQILIASI